MVVKINGITINNNVNDDIFYRKELTEAIEYATITIGHQPKLDLKPFDEIVVDNVKWYLLDYKWSIAEFDTPLYNYELRLANPSIKLKGIILPNRSFTSLAGGGVDLTVKTGLEQYLELYAPDLVLSQELSDILDGIYTGDIQWSKASLFDVINSFLIRFEAVVTMIDYKTIHYKLLTGAGNNINVDNIVNIEGETDFENYATSIKTTIKHGIASTENMPKLVEFVKFTTPDSYLRDNLHYLTELTYPIYKVHELELVFINPNYDPEAESGLSSIPYKEIGGAYADIDGRLVMHLFDKPIYDALKVTTDEDIFTTKLDNLYYEKGSNVIGGWDFDISILGISSIKTLSRIVYNADEDFWNLAFLPFGQGFNIDDYIVKVTYTPIIADVDVEVSKDAVIKKSITYGQDEGFINVEQFGKKQQRILDRAGQEIITIYGVNTPPELLDYYEEYNVYAVETMVNTTQYDWIAYAQYNYANVVLSSAIEVEARNYEFVEKEKAFLFNHLVNVDLTFTTDYSLIDDTSKGGVRTGMFDWAIGIDADTSGYFYANVRFSNTLTTGQLGSFLIPINFMKLGNSIIMHYHMKDNILAGTELAYESVSSSKKAYIQKPLQYVDNIGRAKYVATAIYAGVFFDDYMYQNNALKAKEIVWQLPRRDSASISPPLTLSPMLYTKRTKDWLIYKDNREIFGETLKFNFVDSDEVIFYDGFIDNINLKADTNEPQLYDIYISYGKLFTKKEPFKTQTKRTSLTVVKGNKTFALEINAPVGMQAWIVYKRGTNIPLFAVNSSVNKIYGKELITNE